MYGLSVVCDDAGPGALDPVDPADLGDEVLRSVAALGLDVSRARNSGILHATAVAVNDLRKNCHEPGEGAPETK